MSDDNVRFHFDPGLNPRQAPGNPGSASGTGSAPVPAKPVTRDRSFEVFGGVSYPGLTSPPPSPSPPSPSRAVPSARAQDRPHQGGEARRQRLHRERIRDGFICVTIPIHASEVDGVLIARQLLKPELRNDRQAVADALCDLLETL
jgi:hypothetical protein